MLRQPFLMKFLVLFYLTAFLKATFAFKFYSANIPNADKVRNPFQKDKLFEGLGHVNPAGSGILNPFGRDFSKTHDWLKICHLDSDGDGRSNGEELGDPDCIGQPQNIEMEITHPGICEPIDSKKCISLNIKNGFLYALEKNNTDVQNYYMLIAILVSAAMWLVKGIVNYREMVYIQTVSCKFEDDTEFLEVEDFQMKEIDPFVDRK